jgi:hypothetical protein
VSDERARGPELESWRRTYQDHLQQEGSPDCPAPELLAAAVIGEIADADRRRLAAHVVACRRCAESFRTLLALHREALHREAAAADRPRRWLAPLALAAGLGALVCGLFLLRAGVGPRPGDGGAANPVRTAEAPRTPPTVPAPDANLAAPPAAFSWPPQEEATGYRLELRDAAGTPLWTSAVLRAPRVALPAAVRRRLEPGESYAWTVEALGRVRRRLGPFWFALARSRKPAALTPFPWGPGG